jgi:hypothetical protein
MPEDRPLTFLKYAVACSIVFNIISCPNRESLQLNATCRSCTQKNEDMASAATHPWTLHGGGIRVLAQGGRIHMDTAEACEKYGATKPSNIQIAVLH